MAKIKNKLSHAHNTKPRNLHHRAFEKVYWPYIPVIIAVALLLGAGFNSGNLQSYVKHPGGRVLSYATNMSISGLLADTNSSRAASGVAALNLSNKLDAAAQAKADDMAARNYWSHNTPEGNPPWFFVTAQSYSYQKLGENLATGFDDEQATINGWMNSPPHRENLLDPTYKEVGFGFANNPNYTAAGGGPMTIIVAFYGNPSVLAAATPTTPPPAPVKTAPASQPSSESLPVPAAAADQAPAPEEQQKQPLPVEKTAAPNTESDQVSMPAPVQKSRLQLALTNTSVPTQAASVTISIAILVFLFWASRHIRAVHKFLVNGERYVIKHPLTDITLLALAALLFILSQTAGLIQ
jgi:hypothetical protein